MEGYAVYDICYVLLCALNLCIQREYFPSWVYGSHVLTCAMIFHASQASTFASTTVSLEVLNAGEQIGFQRIYCNIMAEYVSHLLSSFEGSHS